MVKHGWPWLLSALNDLEKFKNVQKNVKKCTFP